MNRFVYYSTNNVLKTIFVEKEEKFKSHKDPIFDSPFFDPKNRLQEFIELVRCSLKSEDKENKFLVSLVQATLSGKTRLILEASMKNPIVLISFKNTNDNYSLLLQSLSIHQTDSCSNFEQREFHNRVIMIKVKLFILAFFEFTLLFQRHIVGSNSNWESVDRMKKIILFSQLINGGNPLIFKIFKRFVLFSRVKSMLHSVKTVRKRFSA